MEKDNYNEILCKRIEKTLPHYSTVVVIGRKGRDILPYLLPLVAVREGKLICINVFPAREWEVSKKSSDMEMSLSHFLDFSAKHAFSPYVWFLDGDAPKFSELIGEAKVDAVILFGSGRYEKARDTILAWYPRIRPGGMMAGMLDEPVDGEIAYVSLLKQSRGMKPKGGPSGTLKAVMELLPDMEFTGRLWSWTKLGKKEAVSDIGQALLRSKREKERADKEITIYINKALKTAITSEDPAVRITMLELLTQDFPVVLNAHIMLGKEYMKLGMPEKALEVLQRPLKNGTGSGVLYSEIGIVLKELGDIGAAESYFKAAVRLTPTVMPAWLNLIIIHMERGETGKARECLNHALSVCPASLDTLRILGKTSIMLGDMEAMQSAAFQIRMQDPDDPLVKKIEDMTKGAPVEAHGP